MTGSAMMDFLIACVGLCIIVYMIFLALDFISPDERFKQIGRYAVGGVALLVVMVVLYIIYMVVDRLAPAELAVPVKYVIGAIALIAILIVAERALFGGAGLGLLGNQG